MIDKADAALALSTVALVPSIFATNLPPVCSVRSTPDYDGAQRDALRAAVLTSSAVVLACALLTRSATVAVAGLVTVGAHAAAYAGAVPAPGAAA